VLNRSRHGQNPTSPRCQSLMLLSQWNKGRLTRAASRHRRHTRLHTVITSLSDRYVKITTSTSSILSFPFLSFFLSFSSFFFFFSGSLVASSPSPSSLLPSPLFRQTLFFFQPLLPKACALGGSITLPLIMHRVSILFSSSLSPLFSSSALSLLARQQQKYLDFLNTATSGTSLENHHLEMLVKETARNPKFASIFNHSSQAWSNEFFLHSLVFYPL